MDTPSGYQLDHHDGSMSCSRGKNCPGVALPHRGWRDCDLIEPCAYCDGPPVVWLCEENGVTVPTSRIPETAEQAPDED